MKCFLKYNKKSIIYSIKRSATHRNKLTAAILPHTDRKLGTAHRIRRNCSSIFAVVEL